MSFNQGFVNDGGKGANPQEIDTLARARGAFRKNKKFVERLLSSTVEHHTVVLQVTHEMQNGMFLTSSAIVGGHLAYARFPNIIIVANR